MEVITKIHDSIDFHKLKCIIYIHGNVVKYYITSYFIHAI